MRRLQWVHPTTYHQRFVSRNRILGYQNVKLVYELRYHDLGLLSVMKLDVQTLVLHCFFDRPISGRIHILGQRIITWGLASISKECPRIKHKYVACASLLPLLSVAQFKHVIKF